MKKEKRKKWRRILFLGGILLCLSGCGQKTSGGDEGSQKDAELKQEDLQETADQEKAETENPAETKGKTDEEDSSGLACPSVNGALHVEGTRLTDQNGTPVQLRGISTHGIAWFPDYINAECFRQLHEQWQANVIRLAMYTAESGGYCTDGDKEALKELIRKGVGYAKEQDMYAIIDWHILSDADPNLYVEEAKLFFDEMAGEYADADHVLYEICNEPNGNTDWSAIKAYASQVIPVIRAQDPDAVIIVGTPNWSQFVDQAAADPITEYENMMYTLHFYAATHTDDLREKMTSAVENGLPVFVSEYGICDASGNGAIDEAQADLWVETMNRLGISYIAWNLSNKEETSAIFQSSCSKISGFTQEDLSESGTWLYRMLTSAADREAGGDGGGSTGNEKTDGGSGSTGNGKAGSQSGGTGNANSGTSRTGAGKETAGKKAVWTSGELEITAVLRESWEAEGKTCYLYDLTLRNGSGTDCKNWEIDVPFQEEPELSDGWNGEYSVQGKNLHIKAKEYNETIPGGASLSDVGFIVSGGNGIAE